MGRAEDLAELARQRNERRQLIADRFKKLLAMGLTKNDAAKSLGVKVKTAISYAARAVPRGK
mgnify:CR=1 FL=1